MYDSGDSGDYAVQQIAAEFGVTRPTIYRPERARADFQDRLTEMRRRLERALDQRFTAEGGPDQRGGAGGGAAHRAGVGAGDCLGAGSSGGPTGGRHPARGRACGHRSGRRGRERAGTVVTEPDRDGAADGLAALPIDPDLDPAEDADAAGRTVAPAVDVFGARRRRRPRLRGRVLAAVFAGGFVGGLARYAITAAWPTPAAGVPWATFAVNTAGAFALALLLVLVTEVWRPTTYVRPLFGTGFLGAFTTFSAVVTTTDQLAARGAAGTAAFYLVISMFAGLAAASFGLVTGRAVAAFRHRNRQPTAGRP